MKRFEVSSNKMFDSLATIGLRIVKNPLEAWKGAETKLLAEIIKASGFFQHNLDSQVNLQDFLELIQEYIRYEKHPYGTILIDTDSPVEKLYVILKGKARKFTPKPIEEIEDEFYRMNTNKKISQFRKESIFSRKSSFNQDETKSTKKETKSRQLSKGKLTIDLSKAKGDGFSSGESSPRGITKLNGQISKFNKSLIIDAKLKQEARRTSLHVPKKSHTSAIKDSIGFRPNSSKFSKKKIGVHDSQSDLDTESNVDEELQEQNTIQYKEKARKEDSELFKHIVGDSQERFNKYLLGGLPKFKRVCELKPGNYFGEAFLDFERTDEEMVISTEEIHLLTISRQDYEIVLKELLSRVNDKVNFFCKLFPQVNPQISTGFCYYFKEENYKKGQTIFHQGDPADTFFIVRSGEIKLTKTVAQQRLLQKNQMLCNYAFSPKSTFHKVLQIANLCEGELFGEEYLIKECNRVYEATATTDSVCYSIENSIYNSIRPYVYHIAKTLKSKAQEKRIWRKERVEYLLEQDKVAETRPNAYATQHRRPTKSPLTSPTKVLSLSDRLQKSKDNISTFLKGKKAPLKEVIVPKPNKKYISSKDLYCDKLTQIYKEKFFRETFKGYTESLINKHIPNSPLASEDDEFGLIHLAISEEGKRKGLTPRSSRNLSESKLPDIAKKHLRIFELTSEELNGMKTILEYRKSEPNLKKTLNLSQMTPRNLTRINSKDSILAQLTPRSDREDTDVIKYRDGTTTIVNGRSKLRGLINRMNESSEIYETILTDRSPISSLKNLTSTTITTSFKNKYNKPCRPRIQKGNPITKNLKRSISYNNSEYGLTPNPSCFFL